MQLMASYTSETAPKSQKGDRLPTSTSQASLKKGINKNTQAKKPYISPFCLETPVDEFVPNLV